MLASFVMKNFALTITCLGAIFVRVQSQNEITKEIFDHLIPKAVILMEGSLFRGETQIKLFSSEFSQSYGEIESYQRNFNIQVHAGLNYEIGEIKTASATFAMMFLKRNDLVPNPGIEFLVIYRKQKVAGQTSEIDTARKEWMKLCNGHQVSELVNRLYTKDAYYYNQGRLLQGRQSLITEYGYMNDDSYSLQLTPKHLAVISEEIAYEVGRCSGSYPNPYMLIWQKQSNGKWQILMDSND